MSDTSHSSFLNFSSQVRFSFILTSIFSQVSAYTVRSLGLLWPSLSLKTITCRVSRGWDVSGCTVTIPKYPKRGGHRHCGHTTIKLREERVIWILWTQRSKNVQLISGILRLAESEPCLHPSPRKHKMIQSFNRTTN